MTRHNNSLLISLFIHAILLLTLFFAWKSYSEVKKEEQEKICLKLCSVELYKEVSEPKEAKTNETAPQNKQKEPKRVKKALKEEKEAEKKIEIANEAKEIKTAIVEIIKGELIVEIVPKRLVKIDKPTVGQKVDDAKLMQEVPKADEYIEINMQKISQLLKENLYYPMSARKRNITGSVKVSFTLGVDAKVYNIKIVESESDILSRAAIKTIEDLSTKFPKPTKELILSVPINYNLN
ncbi:MAG: TonB family protein [Sulfurimonas sp.]|nr:TonB family protein [Sulfurimonas sp.]